MENEDNADVGASTEISSACTSPQDCDLFVNMLPMLCTTSIFVCRRRVLQQAVEALGFSMHETTTRDDESNEILTAIHVNVPPHIRVARMEIKTFYGDWSQTTDAAIQSACFNALVYLQKVKVLAIDSIHSAELKKCQRELLAANSWAEAFKDRADKLQLALSTMIKEKNQVLASPRIQTKVNLLQETVDTKNSTDGKLVALSGYSPVSAMKQQCTNEQLLTPSGSTQTTQAINNKNSTDGRLLAPSGSSSIYTMKQLSTNEELLTPSAFSQIAQHVGSKKFTDGPLLAPSGTPPECTIKQKCTEYLGIDPLDTSKRQILPSSFIGGRRYMVDNFQHAVAVSRVHGAPDTLVWQNKKKRDEVVKDTVLESTTSPVPLPTDRMHKSQPGSTPVCAMKQKCTGEQLLTASGTTNVTQNVATTEIPRGIGFASLTNKPFIFPPDLLKFLRRKRRIIRLPDPVPAHAAFNRKKRKMIIVSQRKKTPALPSLPFLDGSSSEDISIVTDLANEAACAKPNHNDPEYSFTALASPPSVNKPSTLRTSTGLIDSKVRKPLFQDDEDKGKATGLGDEVSLKAGGFAGTDEVVGTSSKKAKP